MKGGLIDEKEFHAIIHGKVQGVWFRDFARKHATELGVSGVARNCEDGTVEVIAQGGEKELKELLKHIKKGPVFSKVEEVEVEWFDDVQDAMTEFIIE